MRSRGFPLARQRAAEFAREGGRLVLDHEIDPDDDRATHMIIAKGCRLEAAAVEPFAHPNHLPGQIAIADADFGAVKIHACLCSMPAMVGKAAVFNMSGN
jgi:hypothetical protein